MARQFSEADSLSFGRMTVEILSTHWPHRDAEDDHIEATGRRLTDVASSTLDEVK